jgi:hypothetical protein
MSVQVPSEATLKKYGLPESEWRAILERQGGVCAVCHQEPKPPKAHPERGGRLCIDHEHVYVATPGKKTKTPWKKLPPEQRRLYVRGLLCWTCNTTYVGRGITITRSRNVTKYLERYEQQKLATGLQPAA